MRFKLPRFRRPRRPRPRYSESLARARREVIRSGRPQALGAICGLVLAFAVFSPWYRADLGGVFTPDTTSGWEVTWLARVVLVLAVAIALSAAILTADQRGAIEIRLDAADRLAWVVLSCALLATILVVFRLAFPPEPAEFFARDWGLFLAVAACAGALLSGISLRFIYS